MSYSAAKRLILSPGFILRRKVVIALIVFAVALIARLYNISYKNIWMDEDAQAKRILEGSFSLDLVGRAASQQQPPIDYYLESIGLANFGLNELGARIHSVLLGSFAAVALFLLLLRVGLSPIATLLATSVFVFHPYLIMYSQEGRPIASGVFFSVAYLYAFISFLLNANKRFLDIRRFALLVAVQTCFLLSVGFQPVPFLAASALATAPLLGFRKCLKKVLFSYLSMAISLLLAIPVLTGTIKHGLRYLPEKSIPDMAVKILGNIGAFSFEGWLKIQRTLIGEWWPLMAVVLILGVAGAIWSHKGDSRLRFAIYIFVFWLIYPAIYYIFFKSLISYGIKPRYYLTFAPVIISFTAVLIHYSLWMVEKVKDDYLGKKSYAICAVVLAFFCYSFFANLSEVRGVYHRMTKTEWKAAYELFKNETKSGSAAYMMNLVKIDGWKPKFYSQNFYYRKEEPRPVVLKKIDQLTRDTRSTKFRTQNRNVYLVTPYGYEKVKSEFFSGLKNVRHFLYNRLSVIKIEGSGDLLGSLVDVFSALKKNLKRKEDNYRVYQQLFYLELQRGNRDGAAEALEALKGMDKRGKLKRLTSKMQKSLKT